MMESAVHLISYAAIAVFIVAVVVRFMRIRNYPINMRWEVYPVPHEGERSRHGGSRLEDVDWWKKEHKPDRIMELKAMIPEMVLLQALWEHNRKLWYRSFPFHFGLYLMIGCGGLLVVSVLLALVGFPLPIIDTIALWIGGVGTVMALVGSLGLLLMRMTDDDLRPYTNFSHYFNLLAFIVTLGLMIAAWWEAGMSGMVFKGFLESLLTLNLSQAAGGPMATAALIALALLVAYVPLTHMSHFFVKWFTWHKIRWDDEPNVRGGRIEKMIEKALQSPMSWSAPHIGADGKKSWVDIAVEEYKGE